MPVILALAACCAVPLVIGAVMVLSGRKKGKAPELDNPGTVQLEKDR